MTKPEILASVIREFTVDFPMPCTFGDYAFTALKGFDTAMGFQMRDSGYEEDRPEDLHVMADQFTEENPPMVENDEIEFDENVFKVKSIAYFPTKAAPLFYKFTVILQN